MKWFKQTLVISSALGLLLTAFSTISLAETSLTCLYAPASSVSWFEELSSGNSGIQPKISYELGEHDVVHTTRLPVFEDLMLLDGDSRFDYLAELSPEQKSSLLSLYKRVSGIAVLNITGCTFGGTVSPAGSIGETHQLLKQISWTNAQVLAEPK